MDARRGRRHLDMAELGPAALAELRLPLEAPPTAVRRSSLRADGAAPASADFATPIAMADIDEVVRLLRAIRDLRA